MTKATGLFVAAVVASFTAGGAYAQTQFDSSTNTAFGGTAQVDDLREDLDRSIEDDFDRDVARFGNEGRQLGFEGSLALRGTATTGNDTAYNLGVGANFGYFDGANGYELTMYYSYLASEDETTDDPDDTETDEDKLLYDFQYTRDFTPQFYGFAKVQGVYNGLDEDDEDDQGQIENDVFVGFGVGYRVINTADQQWSLQAGPGYRFQSFGDVFDTVTDFNDDNVNEAALAISSDYYQRINPNVFVTNDTDIITSDSDTVIYNDLGLNVAMNRQLALRTSLQTEYHSEQRGVDGDATDNQFGVSLVYSFN